MIWLGFASALIAATLWLCRDQLHDSVRREASTELARFDKLNADVIFAFDELRRTATAAPCTLDFMRQIRRVAFLPDGLNEFMYAPGGHVICSTSITPAQPALSLGPPDVPKNSDRGFDIWINKRLDSVGLPGVTGNIVLQDPFAVVIPIQAFGPNASTWLKKGVAMSIPGNRVWHLGGEQGLFDTAPNTKAGDATESTLREVVCAASHPICIAAEADLSKLAFKWRMELLIGFCLLAFYAVWPASIAQRALSNYWSLEQRFRRNLNPQSVVCAYQPILDLRTGEITGCEVLARWLDVDGSIVSPDRFIDFVARSNTTLAFTQMVVDKAFQEVMTSLPSATRLQLNFNIFPRDLDSEKLREVFAKFQTEGERFPIALEIVESDALGIENAQCEIEALARLGIRTYIDDFGTGYSNIHRVASLAIHGVKLDRSFAMAPSESLMARMLIHALDMVGSSGREIVVEGVETQERLDLLIETGRVAHVQGYLVSRPLSIDRLGEFLTKYDPTSLVRAKTRAAA